MFGLLLLMAGSFLVLGWIAWRQPLLVRMGIRNIRRRQSQTVLIVIGLMLSTLVVSAAFATGDTVGYSVTNTIYESFEEVDFVIDFDEGEATNRTAAFTEVGFLEELRAEFADDADIDGITGAISRILPVVNESSRLSDPSAFVVGLDARTADSFKGLRSLNGAVLSASNLRNGDVYITQRLSDEIDAKSGDDVTAYFENAPYQFTVLDVVRDSSLTNQGDTTSGGMAMDIAIARELFDDRNGLENIAVSAVGGVRDTIGISDEIEGRLQQFIDAHPESGAAIALTKKEFVEIGEQVGSIFVTFFLIFGLFSIAAGLMLVFLIFVMLAAERRSEMGMIRAIGLSRLHLTQTYIAEGMAYNIGSAFVGAVLGLGIAWLLIFILARSIAMADNDFDIVFHINPQGFVIAYAAGISITFATVAFSAWRAADVNIVRSIRDLPEPQFTSSLDASWSNLLKGSAGALWSLAWIALFAGLGAIVFQTFVFSLAFFGLPFFALIPIGVFFAYAMRLASNGLRSMHGWKDRLLFWLWVVLLFPLSLPTLGLLKTKRFADTNRNGGGWAVVMLLVGLIFVYLGGWVWGQAFAYTSGATLAMLSLAMLAVYWGASAPTSFTIACVAVIWWWLLPLPFSLIWDGGTGWTDPIGGLFSRIGIGPKEIRGNIEMFFVSGICITAAGTLAIIFNSGFFLSLIARAGSLLGGLVPAIRTAVAYPLAARFRTGITLAMFGLVVFSLVVMAFLNYNFSQLFLGDEASAGFDVVVEGNSSNRIDDLDRVLTDAGYETASSITGIGKLASDRLQFQQDGVAEFKYFPFRGGDETFFDLAELPLQSRAIGYENDAAVLEAMRNDPTLVISSAEILRTDSLFSEPGARDSFAIDRSGSELEEQSWEPFSLTARYEQTGRIQQLKLIGILEPQVTGILFDLVGIIGRASVVEQLTPSTGRESFFLTTVDSQKPFEITTAQGIESSLLEYGVQSYSIEEQIDAAAAQSTGFQLLFEGFMGLGLIVGIAALGVIAFRTVVERRQQIGMLRAIGYSRRLVATSFFFESSFIALAGIGMGVLFGFALSYNLLASPDFTEGAEIDFQVPWMRLAIIVGIAYFASALMTLLPARSASRVSVAEALRYE